MLFRSIRALEALKRPCRVRLYTDSQYLKKGVTEWMPQWIKRGWQTADKKPVKNQDLWIELDALTKRHDVSWHWVRGHAGHVENERADALANAGLEKALQEAKSKTKSRASPKSK